MNIFVTNPDPHVSARVLPDKHVVKMPLETCQMLSIVFSHWYYDWGEVYKKDGTPIKGVTQAYEVKDGALYIGLDQQKSLVDSMGRRPGRFNWRDTPTAERML